MNKTETYQKFIDNELGADEKVKLEQFLQEHPEEWDVINRLKQERSGVINSLDLLNPPEYAVPDTFSAIRKTTLRNRTMLKIAASVAILLGLASAILLYSGHDEQQPEELTGTGDVYPGDRQDEELAFYISPNRCWNDRQMVWIVIEIK